MFKHPRRSIHLLVTLLLMVAVPATLAENGPELPMAPAARQGFVPGPSVSVTPVTPDHAHPAADGVPFAGSEPGVVNFSEIALQKVPAVEGPPRFHIQGELIQSQGSSAPPAPVAATDWSTKEFDLSRPDGAGQGSLKNEVTQNFDGLSSTGFIPPDTVMAPGPNHIVEAVNSGAAIYSKTGATLIGYTPFENFFTSVLPIGWSGFMFDPRVLYDSGSAKFAMLILGLDNPNLKSYFFIAISQTSDPTGQWWLWRFDSNFAGLTADAWLDYAGLGADNWGLYVTGNYFLWTGGFKYSTVISLNPAMYSGGASNGWQFVNLQWPDTSPAFSLQPALPLTVAGGAETFFVNSWSGFGSQLLLWTLTGSRTNSPSLTRAAINVNSYTLIGENVDQPGSATDIDGGDARIMNAFYSQRRVFTALTNDPNSDTFSSGAYLAKLNVDSNSAEWNTTLTGGNGWYYFYPAIVPGGFTTSPPVSVFLSWTQPSSTSYASAGARYYAGPPGDTTGIFPSLAAGLGPYVALDGNNRNRWGDYSGAGYDFAAETMWGAAEYAGSGNTWRTRIAQMGNPAVTTCVPDDNTLCLLDGRYAVTAQYLRGGVLTPARAMTVLDLFGNPSQKTGGMAFEDRQTMAVAVAMRSACEGGFSFDWAAVGSLELGQWELEIRRVEDGATWTRSQPNNGNTSGIDQQAFPCI